MKPLDSKGKLARDWLKRAKGDFAVARELAPKGPQFFVFSLFHSQQAVEKGLKGFMVWHELYFKRVHDIATLGSACRSKFPKVAQAARTADFLTRHAVTTRYPGEDEDPNKAETMHGLRVAKALLKEVFKHLPSEIHPEGFVKRSRTVKVSRKK